MFLSSYLQYKRAIFDIIQLPLWIENLWKICIGIIQKLRLLQGGDEFINIYIII